MRRNTVFVLAVSLLVQSSNHAQSRPFQVYGPIDVSCGTFKKSEGAERQLYEYWIEGFVSGAGYILENQQNITLRHSDPDGITSWTANYCGDHPLDALVKAAISLVEELRRRG